MNDRPRAGIPHKKREVPINLRQTGNSDARVLINTQVRKSPYWHLSQKNGCWLYTIMSHLYHPRAYIPVEEGGLLEEYEYLTKHVTLWNVAAELQIQLKGPDALKFADLLATRDLAGKLAVGQARYVILCHDGGGIVNNPIVMRVAEDEVWFSTSVTDVLLWASGINCQLQYDVEIREIDVSPVQIQGPKSRALMEKLVRHKLLGPEVLSLRYYKLCRTQLNGLDVVISRTGFSSELGYEIYLFDATANADALWETLLEAGEEFNLKVIAPNHIRSLEAGIVGYNRDIDIDTNPFEVSLDWMVDFGKEEFVGKDALLKIREEGVSRKLVGLKLGGAPVTFYNPDFWIVKDADGASDVGYVTTCFYSPKVGSNIAFAMLPNAHNALGTRLTVALPGEPAPVPATVVETPFYDPKKEIPRN